MFHTLRQSTCMGYNRRSFGGARPCLQVLGPVHCLSQLLPRVGAYLSMYLRCMHLLFISGGWMARSRNVILLWNTFSTGRSDPMSVYRRPMCHAHSEPSPSPMGAFRRMLGNLGRGRQHVQHTPGASHLVGDSQDDYDCEDSFIASDEGWCPCGAHRSLQPRLPNISPPAKRSWPVASPQALQNGTIGMLNCFSAAPTL